MRIVFISDTHGHFPKLPEGDLLVHAGDATMMGTKEQVDEFYEWLRSLTGFKYIIFTPGNHDFLLQGESIIRRYTFINDGVVINGVKFWASPYSTLFGSWAFMKSDEDLAEVWKQIPDDIDVLITHGPPRLGVMDKTVGGVTPGSSSLLDRVREVKPKIHVFGHIHEAAGEHYDRGTRFINVSVCNEFYRLVNEPVVIDV